MSTDTAITNKPGRPNIFAQVGSFIWRFVLFWIGLVVFVIGGYMFSVLVEWVCMTFWWEDIGVRHSENMYKIEYNYINRDLANGIFRGGTLEIVEKAVAWTHEFVTPTPGGYVSQFATSMSQPALSSDWNVVLWIKNATESSAEYLLAARNIALVYVLRLTIILLSLPLYLVVLYASTMEGLAQRERRKAGGGIESGFVYHHMKKWRGIAVLLPLVFYLSSPFATHPNIALLPVAAVLWVLNYVYVLKFKKNL